MMNEKDQELLELLRIMSDLQKDGMHLQREINVIIKYLLGSHGFTKEMIYGKKENTK